jgi:hypothetical protein
MTVTRLLTAANLAVLAGCATIAIDHQDRAAGLARLTTNPDRINLTAAITSAVLTLENGCLALRIHNGRTLPVIWPESSELAQDGRGVAVAGKRFSIGDRLDIGGSTSDTIPATETEIIGSFACRGPYVIANAVHHGRPR